MAYEFPPEAVLRLNGYISRGVKAAEVDDRGHLLLTLTDNTVADLGSVKGPQGDRGFVFTPSVDDDGDISWTNNGGLTNPTTKNIRGPRGFKFTPEVSDGGDLSWSNDGGLQNPATKNIRGPRGFKFTPEVSDGGDLSWSNDGGLQNPATKNIRGPQGERGFVFTPSVDDDGDLSWENNGGLQNPATKNIRGPRGFRFTPSVDDSGNLSWTNDGGLQNPTTKNIRGPQGERGFVFTPSVDDSGNLSWTNNGGLTNPTTKNIRGPQGGKGDAGYSPTVTVSKLGKVTTVTITDEYGDHVFKVNDGQDGEGSGDMHTTTYDPTGKAQDIFAYADAKLAPTGDGSNVTAKFTAASSRTNIATGEKLSVIFGKIAKWLADLKAVAFSGSYNDLTNKPDIPSKASDVGAVGTTGDGSNVTAAFTKASSRTNIATGEKLSVLFGKIAKWLSDLKAVAFSGSYTDLTDKPTIPSKASDVGAVGTTGDASNVTAAFTKATSRTNIATGEKLSTIFGKIAKWLADLGSLAFKSTVAKADLAEDVQTSLGKADSALQSAPVTSVNGQTGEVTVSVPDASTTNPLMDGTASYGSGTTYARGNHRHPTDTSRVPTNRTINGKSLASNITLGVMYSATLTASGWTTSGAWKTQTVSVTGLKATYNAAPFVDVTLTGTDATGDAELAAAWLGISETLIADTAANSITVKFPATVDTPTVNIPITITTYD